MNLVLQISILCKFIPENFLIGKMHWGEELFNYIQNSLVTPEEWTAGDSHPHFEYICLDFGNGINLKDQDRNLDPAVLIGLRVAYTYFIHGKYDLSFGQFRMLATPHIEVFD